MLQLQLADTTKQPIPSRRGWLHVGRRADNDLVFNEFDVADLLAELIVGEEQIIVLHRPSSAEIDISVERITKEGALGIGAVLRLGRV